jgi:autotransporter-associated beta strand protein
VSGATATLLARALGDGYGGPIVSGDDASTLIIGNGISLGINNTQQLQGFTGTVLVSTNAGAEIRFSSTSLTINGGELAKFELQGPGLIHTRNGTSEDEGAGVFMGSLTGDATARLEGATSQNRVTRYVIGGNNLSTEYAGIVGLEAGGGNPVAIMKVGTGTLTLSGTNLYEAATTVNDGTLAFTGAGANPTNTSSVTVLSPGVLDVSGLTDGTLYLGNPNGLTLGGDGSIMGSLVVDAAVSTVSVTPGASIGTLTVTNSLTLTANTAITMEVATGNSSDQIAANTLTLGGASITVTNIGGSSLKAGDTFQLFNQPVGDAGTVNLPPEDAYGTYTWNNNLNSDGSVVVATAIPKIDTNPTNITYSVSGGEITITWPESHTGWTLQSQTNALNVGISTNWTDLGYENTNSATLPIDPANPTVFYRITLP